MWLSAKVWSNKLVFLQASAPLDSRTSAEDGDAAAPSEHAAAAPEPATDQDQVPGRARAGQGQEDSAAEPAVCSSHTGVWQATSTCVHSGFWHSIQALFSLQSINIIVFH